MDKLRWPANISDDIAQTSLQISADTTGNPQKNKAETMDKYIIMNA